MFEITRHLSYNDIKLLKKRIISKNNDIIKDTEKSKERDDA